MVDPEIQNTDRLIREFLAGIESRTDTAELNRLQKEIQTALADGSMTPQQIQALQADELTPEQIRDILRAKMQSRGEPN